MSKLPTLVEAASSVSTLVLGNKVDYDGTANYFETDQALTDTPTLYVDLTTNTGLPINGMEITRLSYYMNPANAVTYTLYLFEAANADDTQNKSDIIFQSAAAQAKGTAYEYHDSGMGSWPGLGTVDFTLPQIVHCATQGRIWYLIDWSAAPGNTPGWIKIRGRLLL